MTTRCKWCRDLYRGACGCDAEVEISRLRIVLRKIIYDATGDVENLEKRVWPIRMENYREATELLK